MAALGDSITRAYDTGTLPFGDAAGHSWSTGTRSTTESHYLQILDAEPAIFQRNFNAPSAAPRCVPDDEQGVGESGASGRAR